MKRLNLIGERYGRLTVIALDHTNKRQKFWKCVCDCGNEKIVSSGNLRQGNVKSCGCLAKESQIKRGLASGIGDKTRKHGGFGTKLYGVWAAMIRRCENRNDRYYSDYGGRGIIVCDEWRSDFAAFRQWANETGYREGLTIERVDVNGDYSPNNCKWIPLTEQNRNKRNSVKVEYKGETHTLGDLIKRFGLKSSTTYSQFHKGLTFEEILLRSNVNG